MQWAHGTNKVACPSILFSRRDHGSLEEINPAGHDVYTTYTCINAFAENQGGAAAQPCPTGSSAPGSNEVLDRISDEVVYNSSDGGVDTSSNEGVYRHIKKKKPWKLCKDVCDYPRRYTVGYDPNSEADWMYAKKFRMSMCARKRLSCYARSVKPAIRHYVCEMNKTFTKAGQRMYFSASFTKKHLMEFLSSPVDRMRIKLSSGYCVTYVRLMKGVDNRAAIAHNWSHFARKARLAKGEICVFSLRTCKGEPALTVHKI